MSVLIKRYANRKLYNTQTSRYITLKGIAELIEAGTEVRVVDNESGEDITSVTLSQILVDSERTNRAVPGNLLTELIQRSGDVLSALRKGVGDASEGIEGLQRRVGKLISSREREGGRLSDWVAYSAPDFDRLLQSALERALKVLDLPRRSDLEALNANLERVAKALEEKPRTNASSAPNETPRA
ncbi:MAG TPA: polyhydroxyalkanoate synthesis regulator DNA-binding domain-containing protein [Myxococcota bacterium]|jgi:polyhydroxyalkanoate synthesis repressor PhaR|nr:polyhydroxyalkanoate synthesis regulator DNA-binding domain-containing protein [Myxococcota bacterium]